MKNFEQKTIIVILTVGLISFVYSCKKPTAPTVTTKSVTEVTVSSAKSGGNVTSDGGEEVTVRGVCWSTSNNPTTADDKVISGSGTGEFTCDLTGLDDNTQYFVRAYAVNSEGTAYGDAIPFTTDEVTTVTDIDGNTYDIVEIGDQVWIAENLKTTKFNDGTDIPNVTGTDDWIDLSSPGFCWYNNDETTYGDTYGALYNYYAVTDPKGLCPTGYHVASDSEWATLITYVGGEAVAGGKLKEEGTTHWTDPNTGATDEYSFTALPSGRRNNDGNFFYIMTNGRWWSSTQYDNIDAWTRGMAFDDAAVDRDSRQKTYGLSVRCVKD